MTPETRLLSPSSVRLRKLVPSDQATLEVFLWEALWDPPGQPRRDRAVLQNPLVRAYIENWGSKPEDSGLVAENEDGAAIGIVWSRLLLPPLQGGAFFDEKTPQLGIAVLPPHQGRGIGTRLLEEHLAEADGKFPAISLGVHPLNPALHLYQRFGFQQFVVGKGNYINMVRYLSKT